MQRICAKCQSEKVIPAVRVDDQGQYSSGVLNVAVDQDPGAFIFTETYISQVSAWVCGVCGYMELYAADPRGLYEAYMVSKEKQERSR
jgi:predicted nucleic-acid-binding Zn-ribbon protein